MLSVNTEPRRTYIQPGHFSVEHVLFRGSLSMFLFYHSDVTLKKLPHLSGAQLPHL